MVEFVQYSDEIHRDQFYELNIEYVTWVAQQYDRLYNIDLEAVNQKPISAYVQDFLHDFTRIVPPQGLILVMTVDGKLIGMGAVVELEPNIGEIKRMFIRPLFRGQGHGKELLMKLVEQGRQFGFTTLRLETADFFEAARHLYRSIGFKDIDQYSGGEVSLCLRETTRYMQLDLLNTEN